MRAAPKLGVRSQRSGCTPIAQPSGPVSLKAAARRPIRGPAAQADRGQIKGRGRPSRARPSCSQLFGQLKGVGTPAPTGGESQIEYGSHPGKGPRSAELGPQSRPAPRSRPGPPPAVRVTCSVDAAWSFAGHGMGCTDNRQYRRGIPLNNIPRRCRCRSARHDLEGPRLFWVPRLPVNLRGQNFFQVYKAPGWSLREK
ncbi:hypothetical protein NDU88_000875 [Pleurodeles waltl]|uniref:Uncharacterized protein n=1 Tax=Pleurodeles waltl TaxID=8319 RepID=A0AAV7UUD4_PLEWA|nr:hypothetical protein NDU88_000875 [Pleurodeles waltl]